MIKQLHILNEKSDYTTFRSGRGASNIDVTVTSKQFLSKVVVWEISEQECCSDHSIIRYTIGWTTVHRTKFDVQDMRYIVKKDNNEKFQWNLIQLVEKKLCKIHKEGGTEELDKTLCTSMTNEMDIEKSIQEFQEVVELVCSKWFRTQRASRKGMSNKAVPWWTEELTIMRKSLNALGHRYQRTRNSEEIKE